MYILNIAGAIKKISVREIKDFIFENYYKRIWFFRENSYYSMKRLKKIYLLLLTNKWIEKILDRRNAKEHYQSFIKKKNSKSVKQSEVITYQPKSFENSNIVDIKSIISEHPKKVEKVGSNSSFYSDAKKGNIF